MSNELLTQISNFFPAQYKQAKSTGYALIGDDILTYNGKQFSIIKGE